MTDHVTLMREHAAQLRAQADRYERAANLIADEIATPSTPMTVVTSSPGRPINMAKRPAAKVKAGGRPTSDDLERNRKAVEAHGLTAAAKELGVNYATLYGQATRLGWKVPKVARVRPPSGKQLEKAAAKEATGALRRCERCQQMTRSDPCQHCGHRWKREK